MRKIRHLDKEPRLQIQSGIREINWVQDELLIREVCRLYAHDLAFISAPMLVDFNRSRLTLVYPNEGFLSADLRIGGVYSNAWKIVAIGVLNPRCWIGHKLIMSLIPPISIKIKEESSSKSWWEYLGFELVNRDVGQTGEILLTYTRYNMWDFDLLTDTRNKSIIDVGRPWAYDTASRSPDAGGPPPKSRPSEAIYL